VDEHDGGDVAHDGDDVHQQAELRHQQRAVEHSLVPQLRLALPWHSPQLPSGWSWWSWRPLWRWRRCPVVQLVKQHGVLELGELGSEPLVLALEPAVPGLESWAGRPPAHSAALAGSDSRDCYELYD
jgi:hypothetical protein